MKGRKIIRGHVPVGLLVILVFGIPKILDYSLIVRKQGSARGRR